MAKYQTILKILKQKKRQFSPAADTPFNTNFDVFWRKKILVTFLGFEMPNVNCSHGFKTYKPEIQETL